jgi:predicted DNA-binding protein
MEKLKKDEFVRLRINQIEKTRLNRLEKLTCRKRSDIFRDALYHYLKEFYPKFLE